MASDYEEAIPDYVGGILRVPLGLLDRVAAATETYYDDDLSEIWMEAIAVSFPDTPLGKIRAADPSLLPRWLLERGTLEDLVELRDGGIFALRDCAEDASQPGPEAESILAATLQCRFREGFASEGMLCNFPPIPLRVLDFLQHAEDLLNLALVCKATHKAGHVLLQRELGRDLKLDRIGSARRKRKVSMLESAFRHPIPNTTGSTITPAPKTGTECGADTEEGDHFCQSLVVWGGQTCLDQVMFILVRAEDSPEDPIEPLTLVNQVDPGLPSEFLSPDEYREFRSRSPVVLDGEAVKRAAAMLEVLDLGTPDAEDWDHGCASKVVRIVQAAQQEGQGLILHIGFFHEGEVNFVIPYFPI